MLNTLIIPLTFLVLLIASYVDLKKREVPDWLSYGFLFAIFGIRAIVSIHQGWSVLLSGILGFLLLLGIGYLFYKTSQWGGGDAKLLMGMGAAIGLSWPLQPQSLTIIWYFLLLLFLGAAYGLLWIAWLAWKEKTIVAKKFGSTLQEYKYLHLTLLALSIVLIFLTIYQPLLIWLIPLPLGIFYLLILVHIVEQTCFFKHLPASRLTEGDWLAEDIMMGSTNLPSGTTLSKKDLSLLQKRAKPIRIKEGIPFVPSFLLAYLAYILSQDFWPFIALLFP